MLLLSKRARLLVRLAGLWRRLQKLGANPTTSEFLTTTLVGVVVG
jgi:hypothetical protein